MSPFARRLQSAAVTEDTPDDPAPQTPPDFVATYSHEVTTFTFNEVEHATLYRVESEFISA